jgi:hypothetical protein
METIFEKYRNITGIDISAYLLTFTFFIQERYPNIVSYYTKDTQLKSKDVEQLEDLYKDSGIILKSFETYKTKLSELFEFWDLLDRCETINNTLETIINSQRWFRSNKSLTFDGKFQRDYVLKQGQTLSNLAGNLGYTQENNDWVDIALRNNLPEEEYNVEGGAILKITFQNNISVTINSVIDAVTGESIYGKDVDRSFVMEQDENGDWDLKVLNYKDTIYQTYNILLKTFRGSVPEFPNDGIEKDILGGNVNSVQYPVLARQLSDLFSKDDSFRNFKILKIDPKQDHIEIDVEVETYLGLVLNQTLVV